MTYHNIDAQVKQEVLYFKLQLSSGTFLNLVVHTPIHRTSIRILGHYIYQNMNHLSNISVKNYLN